jgi:hypothetical protein
LKEIGGNYQPVTVPMWQGGNVTMSLLLILAIFADFGNSFPKFCCQSPVAAM